jgi:hypothetical protein
LPRPSKVGPRCTVTPSSPTVGEADGVVLPGEDGLAEVEADLGRVDVEGGDELDVAHVVAAEVTCIRPGHVSSGSASR